MYSIQRLFGHCTSFWILDPYLGVFVFGLETDWLFVRHTGPHSSVPCRTLPIPASQTSPMTPTEMTTGSSSLYKTTFHLWNRIRLRSPSSRVLNSEGTFLVVPTSERSSRSDLRYVPGLESRRIFTLFTNDDPDKPLPLLPTGRINHRLLLRVPHLPQDNPLPSWRHQL